MLTMVGKVEDPRASCHSSSFPPMAYLRGDGEWSDGDGEWSDGDGELE